MRLFLLFLCASTFVGCTPELPGVIKDEMAATAQVKPRAATVVFFTDFQCPFCRKTHLALAPLLTARRERVRVVFRHVPLPRHPDARTAARAMVCVERIAPALVDDYAHALVEAQDLSEAALKELALERGVAGDRYERCLADTATEMRIEHDLAMFDAVRGEGVPLLYIGRTRLDGAQSREALEAALDEALSR